MLFKAYELGVWVILIGVQLANTSITLYPYGSAEGDTLLPSGDDRYSVLGRLTTDVSLNATHFSVSINGLISFNAGNGRYIPISFPTTQHMIVAPFWADIYTYRGGGFIWYRQIINQTNNDSALTDIILSVQKFQLKQRLASNFQPTFTLIVTWENVSFYGANTIGFAKRNTFQCVIVGDVNATYAMFLYKNIEWTSGRTNGGRADTGLGGKAAHVGFNIGDGIHYFQSKVSGTCCLLDLPDSSNFGVPGKWIFRLDASNNSVNNDGTLYRNDKSCIYDCSASSYNSCGITDSEMCAMSENVTTSILGESSITSESSISQYWETGTLDASSMVLSDSWTTSTVKISQTTISEHVTASILGESSITSEYWKTITPELSVMTSSLYPSASVSSVPTIDYPISSCPSYLKKADIHGHCENKLCHEHEWMVKTMLLFNKSLGVVDVSLSVPITSSNITKYTLTIRRNVNAQNWSMYALSFNSSCCQSTISLTTGYGSEECVFTILASGPQANVTSLKLTLEFPTLVIYTRLVIMAAVFSVVVVVHGMANLHSANKMKKVYAKPMAAPALGPTT